MLKVQKESYFRDIVGFQCQKFDFTFVPPHSHEGFYEFFIIISGDVIHTVNGLAQQLSRGYISLIRDNDYHSYTKFSDEKCIMYNIVFSKEILDNLILYLHNPQEIKDYLKMTTPYLVRLHKEEIDFLSYQFNELCRIESNSFLSVPRARLFIASLFNTFITSKSYTLKDENPKWFSKLLYEMQEKEAFVRGVPYLVELSNKSHEYLCRMFKQSLNCTPVEYINTLRLSHAEFLVSNSNLSILNISLDCGFLSLSNFNYLFKKHYKMSPLKYRKSV